VSSRGQFNSSITRVRPFFGELLARDASGTTWLPGLLAAAPRASALGDDVRKRPGRLLPAFAEPRDYRDRVLGRTIRLARCFEHPAPPSRAFLGWLIEHPDQLHWPQRSPGVAVRYGDETQRLREELLAGPAAELDRTQARALAELMRHGPAGSRGLWWAFEGFTEVDCWLETERLLLFVEGKRTEPLSPSTDWYPKRNQLVRNLEVVGELADGRPAAVLLVSEQPVVELTDDEITTSTPHLDEQARTRISRRYLGQTTWRELCDRLGVDFYGLPRTIADVENGGSTGHSWPEPGALGKP